MKITKKSLPIMALVVGALALSGCAKTITATAAKAILEGYDGAENYASVMKIDAKESKKTTINNSTTSSVSRTYQIDRTENNYYAYINTSTFIPANEGSEGRTDVIEMLLAKSGDSYRLISNESGSYLTSTITADEAKSTLDGLFTQFQQELVAASNSEITAYFTGEEVEGVTYEQAGQSITYKLSQTTPDGMVGSYYSRNQEISISNKGFLVLNSANFTESGAAGTNDETGLITTVETRYDLYKYDTNFTKLTTIGGVSSSTGETSTDSGTSETSSDSVIETTSETTSESIV